MNYIEHNLDRAKVACANFIGYVESIESTLMALELAGITGPRALALSIRGLLPRAERQLARSEESLRYADSRQRFEVENIQRHAGVIRKLKALADENDPQPEPSLCELAGEIAGMRSVA